MDFESNNFLTIGDLYHTKEKRDLFDERSLGYLLFSILLYNKWTQDLGNDS